MGSDRKSDRARSILGARIIFNHGNSTIDCQIRNISASGAKLDVSQAVSIPEEFDIDVPQRGKVYRARLCWRDSGSAGIEFVQAGAAISGSALGPVAALEAENAALRLRVLDLTNRLEAALAALPKDKGAERAA